MSDSTDDEARNREFLQLTDQFIELANLKIDHHDPSMVSAAFMFASSRFCAFSVAAQIDDEKEFEKEKGAALEHYSAEYYNMLEQNMDSHSELLNENTEER